jgi:hypothetical protein
MMRIGAANSVAPILTFRLPAQYDNAAPRNDPPEHGIADGDAGNASHRIDAACELACDYRRRRGQRRKDDSGKK